MIPETYKTIDNVCANCKNCLRFEYHDMEDEYFCHIDKSERPKNLDENQNYYEKDYKAQLDSWRDWARKHEVLFNGTCDKFDKKEIDN